MKAFIVIFAALGLAIAACSGSVAHDDTNDAGESDALRSGGAGASGLGGSGGGAGIDASDGASGADAGNDAGCTSSSQCLTSTAACVSAVCVDGECQVQNTPPGTLCTIAGSAKVCDGSGECVECNHAGDCEPDQTCQANQCVPVTCTDGSKNGVEADVDCGGPACLPCANGLSCGSASDCASGFCDPSTGKCAACNASTDCQDAGKPFCDQGVCSALKPNGGACLSAGACISGHCVDGVCCAESNCGPSECYACNAPGFEGSCHEAASGKLCSAGKCDGSGVCASGGCLWNKSSSNTGSQHGRSVAFDANGNVLVTGDLIGTLDFGCGPLTSAGYDDVFIVKLDPGGACLWSKRAGDSGSQSGLGVAVDQFGNPHVVGHFAGSVDFGCGPLTNTSGTDAFVVKLDASGACVWSKRAGNDGFVEATDVAIDGAGNVLITGEFNGAMAFGCNPPLTTSSDTLFTAKLAQSGACLWLKKTPNAHRAAIATDGAGNVLLGGYLSFGVADLGCGAHTTSGEWDAFFAKLDASGNCVWSKSTLGQQQETTTDIAVDDLDNLYLTGFFNGVVDFGCGSMGSGGSYDLFAAKVDPQGACVWSKRAGDAYSQRAFGVAVDKSGNVIVTGDASAKLDLGCGPLTATGSYAFVAKLDSKGACLWHKATVSTGPVWPLDVDVDHNASAVITGEFSGAVDFGCSSLLFSGDKAAFIAKYAP